MPHRDIVFAAEGRGDQAEFIRNQYYGLEWHAGPGALGAGPEGEGAAPPEGQGPGETEPLGAGVLVTDEDLYCELRLTRAGSFHYYFVYDTA